jgi:hypothetical protein
MDEFGGELFVYTWILSVKDCTILAQEFDRLEEESRQQVKGSVNHSWIIGYMQAVADRREKMGCGDPGFS